MPIANVVFSVKKCTHVGMLFESTRCLYSRIPRNLLRSSFSLYSCLVSWICFGPYCCLYPTTILMKVALNRTQWRVCSITVYGTMQCERGREPFPATVQNGTPEPFSSNQ